MNNKSEIHDLYAFEDLDFSYYEGYFNPNNEMDLKHRRAKVKKALLDIQNIFDNAVKRGYYNPKQ